MIAAVDHFIDKTSRTTEAIPFMAVNTKQQQQQQQQQQKQEHPGYYRCT